MDMNILTLQKRTQKQIAHMERVIKKASRVLLEFEVAQAKWEKKKRLGKRYSSVAALMGSVARKPKYR